MVSTTEIAFLGMGAMGSRMAGRLLQAGYAVTVWNRTPSAGEALRQAGARVAATPREAAERAGFVISMLRDDTASHAVWCDPRTGALAAMKPGSIAIESSTLSPDWITALDRLTREHGIPLLEAPVSGSRPQAENGQLVYLLGGEASTVARSRDVLNCMSRAVHHLGPAGSGARVKLATNTLLGLQVTGLAEIISLLTHGQTDVNKALHAMASTSAWSPVADYLALSMTGRDFAPQFPVELIEKDFGYFIAAAGEEKQAPTIAASRSVFGKAVAAGLGQENMTAVVKLFD
jgi:3-hydroxyisobutyrate dehydrogenase